MTVPPEAITAAPDEETWHRALQAGMQAQRDFRHNNGNPEWDSDWDDEAEAIIEAAWTHIAKYEHAVGAAAERDRIRQGAEAEADILAQSRFQHVRNRAQDLRRFADLLREPS